MLPHPLIRHPEPSTHTALLAQLPNLLELYDAVIAHPGIAAYRSSEQHLPMLAPLLP